jgi:hypothetical protein
MIPSGQRMAYGIVHRTIVLVPLARAPVQDRYLFRLLCHQVHPKDISKEMVITVPAPLIIQRRNKQVGAFEKL